MKSRDSDGPPPAHRPIHTHHVLSPRRAVGRFVLSASLALLVLLITPRDLIWGLRSILAWDVFAFSLLLQDWAIVSRSSPQSTELRAGDEDPGRALVFAVAVLGSLFSLFAATFALRRVAEESVSSIWLGLSLGAVGLSWLVTHTSYTLRYAHLYYRGKTNGGLEFPGTKQPDDMDFAYFAFTVGMCFQVSDVQITTSKIRRTCLVHSLIAFIFNTTILALSLNVMSQLFAK